jgi:hypothetical protein
MKCKRHLVDRRTGILPVSIFPAPANLPNAATGPRLILTASGSSLSRLVSLKPCGQLFPICVYLCLSAVKKSVHLRVIRTQPFPSAASASSCKFPFPQSGTGALRTTGPRLIPTASGSSLSRLVSLKPWCQFFPICVYLRSSAVKKSVHLRVIRTQPFPSAASAFSCKFPFANPPRQDCARPRGSPKGLPKIAAVCGKLLGEKKVSAPVPRTSRRAATRRRRMAFGLWPLAFGPRISALRLPPIGSESSHATPCPTTRSNEVKHGGYGPLVAPKPAKADALLLAPKPREGGWTLDFGPWTWDLRLPPSAPLPPPGLSPGSFPALAQWRFIRISLMLPAALGNLL